MKSKKTILVAPLFWGLGHATRCIPIIDALLARNYRVIIGSDGEALALLQKEFPSLTFVTLPSYEISYAKHKKNFKTHLIKQGPHIRRTIKSELKQVVQLKTKYNLDGIISDNRYGVRHPDIPSVVMTHQLKVLSGNTTWLSALIQKKMLQKFDAIWVPDFKKSPNLSGSLGHLEHADETYKNLVYLGPLSRLNKLEVKKKYDILVVLSGPEPQRGILEQKLITLLENNSKKILFVRGVVSDISKTSTLGGMTVVDFLTTQEVELAINQSEIVICRSGYTSIMDLAALQKKAFLIPTPGQFEQEYLAKRFNEKGMLPYANQAVFKLSDLNRISVFSGLPKTELKTDFDVLFGLF